MSGYTQEVIPAGEIHSGHIGVVARWYRYDRNTEIAVVTTAEIRQVSHNGAETHLTFGLGAEHEVTLAHDHPVVLGPADDYTDSELFIAGAS